MARTVYLKTPLTEEDVRGLQLDDVVYLTGDAYTMMYIDHFTRLTGMIKAGEPLPMELKGNVIYNTGTIFRREEDGTYDFRAIGATTSSKFNAYTPEFIRLSGVRAVIGKGGMDRNVLDAMQECGFEAGVLAAEELGGQPAPAQTGRLRSPLRGHGCQWEQHL